MRVGAHPGSPVLSVLISVCDPMIRYLAHLLPFGKFEVVGTISRIV